MGQNRSYLAHEYFNRDWNCMYFTDVVDMLSGAKLEFASSASPFDLVDAINLPVIAQEFLKTVSNPILREQSRDYFINQQFRKDLFIRGAARLHPAEMRNRLLDTKFILTTDKSTINFTIRGAAGEAQLQQAIYHPILEALTSNGYAPKTMRELALLESNPDFGRTFQALIVLVGMGVVSPCQPDAHAKAARRSCDALNMQVLQMGQSSSNVSALASPVTGAGVAVDRISQLFLLGTLRKKPDQAQFAWEILQNSNELLVKDGQALQGADANLAELRSRLDKFKTVLPIFKALQIA